MYADLKAVDSHSLLMPIMINLKTEVVLLLCFLFLAAFTIRFQWKVLNYHFPLRCLMLSSSLLTPQLQTSLCQNELLREASIPSREWGRGAKCSFLYWCISEVPQGNPVACPPLPPALGAGRQAEAAASPSWRPWSHWCCWCGCCCCWCWATNEMPSCGESLHLSAGSSERTLIRSNVEFAEDIFIFLCREIPQESKSKNCKTSKKVNTACKLQTVVTLVQSTDVT